MTDVFSLQIDKFIEKVGGDVDQVVRKVTLDLLSSVVLRSPVGNPELWAANREAIYGRETHNLWVDRINEGLLVDPANLTRRGKLKRGVKKARKLGQQALKQAYPLRSGKGYVGGRFRGNWQVTTGIPASGQLPTIDPSGTQAIQAGSTALADFTAGQTIYIVNNLPYASRLEYGWSKQAPGGMVRLAITEFQQFVDNAVREIQS